MRCPEHNTLLVSSSKGLKCPIPGCTHAVPVKLRNIKVKRL